MITQLTNDLVSLGRRERHQVPVERRSLVRDVRPEWVGRMGNRNVSLNRVSRRHPYELRPTESLGRVRNDVSGVGHESWRHVIGHTNPSCAVSRRAQV